MQLESVSCNLCGKKLARLIAVENDYQIVRCLSCGLNYLNPRPKQVEQEAMIDSQQFQDMNDDVIVDMTEHLKGTRGLLLMAKHRMDIIENYSEVGSLLDVGCGIGHLVKVARDRGWKAIGVEPSADRAAFGRQTFDIPIVESSLEDFSSSQTFQVISLFNVLSHLRNPLEALKNLVNNLDPDGIMVLRTGNKGEIATAEQAAMWKDPWGAPDHLYWFSDQSIRKLCERLGLTILAQKSSSRMEIALRRGNLAKPGGAPFWIKTIFYYLPILPKIALPIYNRTLGKKDQSRSNLYILKKSD